MAGIICQALASQIMLATSFQSISINKRRSTNWRTTWQALSCQALGAGGGGGGQHPEVPARGVRAEEDDRREPRGGACQILLVLATSSTRLCSHVDYIAPYYMASIDHLESHCTLLHGEH
jgi:hypothetical protein